MRKDFLGRGWKFPFQINPSSGGIALSEYEENIRENITIILGTKPGERQMLPEFGCKLHELMFAPNTKATATLVAYHVRKALERWEPRIEVQQVQAWPDPGGELRVQVQYLIKSIKQNQELDLLLNAAG